MFTINMEWYSTNSKTRSRDWEDQDQGMYKKSDYGYKDVEWVSQRDRRQRDWEYPESKRSQKKSRHGMLPPGWGVETRAIVPYTGQHGGDKISKMINHLTSLPKY